jgi:hypothetical protein
VSSELDSWYTFSSSVSLRLYIRMLDFSIVPFQCPQTVWKRLSWRETGSDPLAKISWTNIMRCSVARIKETKQTFSTVPRMLRTRTQMGQLDLEEVVCWVRRSELRAREKPVCHSLRLHSLSFIESSS